jgi:M6 family metalloprotease-like protein
MMQNGANNAKIDWVSPQSSSLRDENVGKFYQTWNPGIAVQREENAMSRSRWMLAVLLVTCLWSVTACRRGTIRPALPTVPVDTTNLDPKLGLHALDAVGDKKYIVIMADFPNVQRQYSDDIISQRALDFVSNYYYEASYHKLNFTGTMTKHYVLPNPVEYYKIKPANLDVDPQKVISLVTDVVNAADDDVAFSEDLYVIIALGATPAEYGMVGYSAVPGMLGFSTDTAITTNSGETVSQVVVFCENAHLGTYIHDTLHMLGGVEQGRRMTPCLYDHDIQAQVAGTGNFAKALINMGYWDPLSSHAPYDMSLPPTGLSAWTRLRLGWIDPDKIALIQPGETATVTLDPLVSDEAETLVIKIPLGESRYYMIENRQPIESDANLPSSGVLISLANDTVLECRNGTAPVKLMDANPSVLYLNDAAFDIGNNDRFIDTVNNIAIVLLEKTGSSYVIQITTPDQVE